MIKNDNDCLYPDWEGKMIGDDHILDKDGYCKICGVLVELRGKGGNDDDNRTD